MECSIWGWNLPVSVVPSQSYTWYSISCCDSAIYIFLVWCVQNTMVLIKTNVKMADEVVIKKKLLNHLDAFGYKMVDGE